MKKYIFEYKWVGEDMLRVTIQAFTYDNAYELLAEYVKNPADFKCLNP